jgi:hypothetical protein
MSKNQNPKKVLEKIYNILQYFLKGLKEMFRVSYLHN